MRTLLVLSICVCALAQTPKPTALSAAELLGLPADQVVDASIAPLHLEALGLDVIRVKGVLRDGTTVGATIDARGHHLDLGQLLQAELTAREADPLKKLHPHLRQALDKAGPSARLRIVAWLRFDPQPLDERARELLEPVQEANDNDAVLAAEEELTRFVMERNRETTEPVAEMMRGMGLPIRHIDATAPVICTEATPGEILALAAMPEIDTLYLENLYGEDLNEGALATHRTATVHKAGVKGRGIRVAILENNGVDPANPYLNVVAWADPGNPNPDAHVQGTSGNVASQLASRLGSAPDVDLYSANAASYSDTDLMTAHASIASWNIDVTNMSFKVDASPNIVLMDRYFEYQSRFLIDSYVAAGGNEGNGNDNVTSPAKAWNVLAVGAFDDGPDGDWTGDAMASFSSTSNPVTGVSKPNVAAAGVDIDTLGSSAQGWLQTNSGTSFASPFTAANLANAMVVDSSLLSPEPAMALMMATAWHNIEGSSTNSAADGAGGIHGLAAYRAASENRVSTHFLSPGSFNNNGYYTVDIFLQKGDRTRVCIAWGAQGDSSYNTAVLNADLDLVVYQGSGVTSGSPLGFSVSVNNNFELVEFTPPETGIYTVRVNDFAFNGTSERMGLAWSQKTHDTSDFKLREYTSEISQTSGPTIGRPAYYMDFQAPNSPGAVYLCAPGSTIGDGFSFSSQTWGPLSIDIWTLLWFDHITSNNWFWTGYTGTLSPSGTTLGNRMSLPALLPLVGTELSHVGYTLDPGYPDSIKEISQVHTFKFWPVGTDHAATDDGSILVDIPFPFTFYGNVYTQVYVNSNGNLTFGSGDSDFTESQAEMLSDQPRIALFWDDLAPQLTGAILRTREVIYGSQELVVEFINVPQFNGTDDNTGRVILRPDGTIKLQFRDCDLQDCIVGISPGNGISAAGPMDLTSSGERRTFTPSAMYEVFTATSPLDVTSTSTIYYSNLLFTPNSNGYRLTMDIDP